LQAATFPKRVIVINRVLVSICYNKYFLTSSVPAQVLLYHCPSAVLVGDKA